jgi:hypothetical protein
MGVDYYTCKGCNQAEDGYNTYPCFSCGEWGVENGEFWYSTHELCYECFDQKAPIDKPIEYYVKNRINICNNCIEPTKEELYEEIQDLKKKLKRLQKEYKSMTD